MNMKTAGEQQATHGQDKHAGHVSLQHYTHDGSQAHVRQTAHAELLKMEAKKTGHDWRQVSTEPQHKSGDVPVH